MKCSICTTSRKQEKLELLIEKALELGLAGIEIWDGHIEDYIQRGSTLDSLKDRLDSAGLKCCCISPYFHMLNRQAANDTLRTAARCAEYASGLQCDIIRTFLGDKSSKELSADERMIMEETLQAIAEKYPTICFAVETHYGQPSDDPDKLQDMLERIALPNIKVLFDSFNLYVDGYDVMNGYQKLRRLIVHHHIKNYHWKIQNPKALQDGDVDFEPLVKQLLRQNIFASFEYFCEQQYTLIASSMRWITSLKEEL